MSPYHPKGYLNHLNCTWTIHASNEAEAQLRFTAFELEDGCFDNILVYADGIEKEKLCGTDGLGQFYEAANSLQVVFTTDRSVTNKGFKASYRNGKRVIYG